MHTIIQQLGQELLAKIEKRLQNGEFSDLDRLASDLLEDCTDSARQILQAAIKMQNLSLRQNKAFRKQEGLLIKEKDRPRQLLTRLGLLKWSRDYYFDRKQARYVFPLDDMLGIRGSTRIGDEVVAQLLNRATEVSYARSADIVTGGAVSRQTVRNHLLKLDIPQPEAAPQRQVRELHVYADEDHVHLQKPGKKKGKRNQSVPLVTITEGTMQVSKGRRRTCHPTHFVEESLSGTQLWKSVEGFIAKAYDLETLDKIYLHGDGGNWIKSGLSAFAQTQHVMDGYHFYRELRQLTRRHPRRNTRQVLLQAIEKDDRRKAEEFLQKLTAEDERVKAFSTYLFWHWSAIRNLVTLDIPGSCTEGQVSHVLSERFSRNPMGWSKAGLGKLSALRVYRLNGGQLTGADLKPKQHAERYAEYADHFLRMAVEGAKDWSLFEARKVAMDGNSGTQHALKYLGTNYGI